METYIIKTHAGEYYCGKSDNIDKRMKEHRNEKKPHWFAFKNRKSFQDIIVIPGDYEKQIKRAGVKLIWEITYSLYVKGAASR